MLSYDDYYNIMLHMDYKKLLLFCKTSKTSLLICQQPHFWKSKCNQDYDHYHLKMINDYTYSYRYTYKVAKYVNNLITNVFYGYYKSYEDMNQFIFHFDHHVHFNTIHYIDGLNQYNVKNTLMQFSFVNDDTIRLLFFDLAKQTELFFSINDFINILIRLFYAYRKHMHIQVLGFKYNLL